MDATNILPRGRRRRMVNGIILSALALVLSLWLVTRSPSSFWGVLVFGLVWLAALMLLQARDHT